MTVQELVNNLQQCNNSQAEVVFHSLFDVAAHSSVDDFEKEISLRFTEVEIKQHHPTKVQVWLS